MSSDSNDDAPLADRVQAGDHHALAELFGRHRERLLKMVRLRLDRRLRGRLDPEDVLQESFLDAAPAGGLRRQSEYASVPLAAS